MNKSELIAFTEDVVERCHPLPEVIYISEEERDELYPDNSFVGPGHTIRFRTKYEESIRKAEARIKELEDELSKLQARTIYRCACPGCLC